MTTLAKPKLWVPGDWNAFFGFGTNILVNVLTLTGLLRFVLGFPDELVFGRVLPGSIRLTRNVRRWPTNCCGFST